MKLLTKDLEAKIPGPQKSGKDPMVYVKFFQPFSNWEWYPTEYDKKERMFFGLVHGFEDELRLFSLDELECVREHGIGIERDAFFKPVPLSEVRNSLRACE